MQATAASGVHINAVTFLGAKTTRRSFLEKIVEPVLEGKTVADVINRSQETAHQLQRFQIFDDVQLLLDRASDTDPLAAPGSINVIYRLKERSRLFIKTGTEIGNNEGSMVKLSQHQISTAGIIIAKTRFLEWLFNIAQHLRWCRNA